MVSEAELRNRIGALLSGDVSLDDFEDWFTVASWNAHKDSPYSAQQLVGAVELRLGEFSSGHLSYDELQQELEALIRAQPVYVSLSINSDIALSVNISISAAHRRPFQVETRDSSAFRRVAPVPA